MITFEESNMTFSFEEDDVFRIEKSMQFNCIAGAKTCECVVMFHDKVTFIEAKSSSPQPRNNGIASPVFERFTDGIADKFSDSLAYFTATHLKRHLPELLPIHLQAIPLSKQEYEFCLIIFGHQTAWLPPVLDQLKKSMKKMLKLWGLNDACIKVLNEHMALSKGLIKNQ